MGMRPLSCMNVFSACDSLLVGFLWRSVVAPLLWPCFNAQPCVELYMAQGHSVGVFCFFLPLCFQSVVV